VGASAAAVLILWTAGFVFLLGEWVVSAAAPWNKLERRCRVHQWTRTEKGFLCRACGWRCETGADAEGDPPPLP
jgi:hypothetical protein